MERMSILDNYYGEGKSIRDKITELEEENKNLNEFKNKREESMFYFKAQMERAEPKTAREAEDLQRAKEIFEKLYREELSGLEEENKKLKERVSELEDVSKDYDLLSKDFIALGEENEKLKEKQKVLDKENCELIDENVELKKELKEKNELLSNVARCSEQYRGKMISVMEELKMFLYKN